MDPDRATADTVVDSIQPHPELLSHDICHGADPYVFFKDGYWHLLLNGPSHMSIRDCTIRSATSIPELVHAVPRSITVEESNISLRDAWAAEVHFGKYLYVAAGDGRNFTHRMHVYETGENVDGPWRERGIITMVEDRWAIDLTVAEIPYAGDIKTYAVWSGWEDAADSDDTAKIVPQNLYIAEMLSPMQVGKRHLLARPHGDWCSSVASILEGPQTLRIEGEFKGFLVTGNASWTDRYATSVLVYRGGDPLLHDSWHMTGKQLFIEGHGIGHGMIVEDGDQLYFIGHRKTRRAHGWADRMVFYCPIDRDALLAHVRED